MQSSSVEEVEEPAAVSECKCTNEILEDSLTPAPTSEDESSRQLLDFRSRSLSLPCQALRGDELTKLISTTDSDSCDALAGPALNLMDRSRFSFYSMPTTTTTDTDSSMDLPHMHHFRQQRPPSYNTQLNDSNSNSNKSVKTNSPANTSVHSPVTEARAPPVVVQDNGSIQQFKIVEPKQNGNVDRSASSQGDKDTETSGLFGSLRRQLFPNNHGKVGEKHKAPAKKKGHKKAGHGEEAAPKNADFFSAERHKRKLAKARERRATLVLGLVMAAFILCWLPFFIFYVVSAFCVGCIPVLVFTVFFWIGYCNSALNPIIYTVFNRDFRRAFQRILFGRRRGRR